MRVARPRLSLLSWLLAGALLLSVALNVYCLTLRQHPRAAALWAVDDNWDDEEDDDDDDDRPLPPSRAALADELRRARLQLSRCQHSHAAAPAHKSARHRSPHPHG